MSGLDFLSLCASKRAPLPFAVSPSSSTASSPTLADSVDPSPLPPAAATTNEPLLPYTEATQLVTRLCVRGHSVHAHLAPASPASAKRAKKVRFTDAVLEQEKIVRPRKRPLSDVAAVARDPPTVHIRNLDMFDADHYDWIRSSDTYRQFVVGHPQLPMVRLLQERHGGEFPLEVLCPHSCTVRAHILHALWFWDPDTVPPVFFEKLFAQPVHDWPDAQRAVLRQYLTLAVTTPGRRGQLMHAIADVIRGRWLVVHNQPDMYAHLVCTAALRRGRVDLLDYAHRRLGAALTPGVLQTACEHGHPDLLQYLRAHGATPLTADHVVVLARAGHVRAMHLALKSWGAPCTLAALEAAAEAGQLPALVFLCSQRRTDEGLRGYGCVPTAATLEAAARARQWPCVTFLARRGTPFSHAAVRHIAAAGEVEILRLALEHALSAPGVFTPEIARVAAQAGHAACVALLQSAGAPLDADDCLFYVTQQMVENLDLAATDTATPTATAITKTSIGDRPAARSFVVA